MSRQEPLEQMTPQATSAAEPQAEPSSHSDKDERERPLLEGQSKALTWLVLGSVIAVWLDQWSKRWALETLYLKAKVGEVIAPDDTAELYSKHIEVTSWFNFHLVGNKGAAWGIFKNLPEQWRVLFFAVLTVAALGMMLVMFLQSRGQTLMRVALILIIGGALGNFIDRLNIGYVIDFIDWHYGAKHWPTFNIADVWISVGVGLMLIDMITQGVRDQNRD